MKEGRTPLFSCILNGMKNTVLGILAHVDAGKTTLVESLLYTSRTTRRLGRVDKGDSVLDNDLQERARGITIYSKEAGFEYGGLSFQVIDTPGHADFSSEMERALSVIDLAVVLVSGLDGVQAHTKTIWKLLESHSIPAVVFVNKMDISHKDEEALMKDLSLNLSPLCIRPAAEEFAMLDERLMEHYLDQGQVDARSCQDLVMRRLAFPVYFGSALKQAGIEELLHGLCMFAPSMAYPPAFGARVFKVETCGSTRLTHMKITGGELSARQMLSQDERADQIRIWQAGRLVPVASVAAGMVCAVSGPVSLVPGDVLGSAASFPSPVLQGSMEYELLFPAGVDPVSVSSWLQRLVQEDPSLNMEVKGSSVHLTLMGMVQMEVLQKRLYEMTGLEVGFGPGRPVYAETIRDTVTGLGHFEPLRHYAEVHVRLEPGQPGSGIVVVNGLGADDLPARFQAQILNALKNKRHKGVLTGSYLTDVKITVVAAKGHLKHTESGDFRQAACRAVRQGLMQAESVLLEPASDFVISVPVAYIGKVLAELERIGCQAQTDGESISGTGPAHVLAGFSLVLRSMCRGAGSVELVSAGYRPCPSPDAVIGQMAYEPCADLANPADSVFCANGAGYTVSWDEVAEHMHIPLQKDGSRSKVLSARKYSISQEEAQRVFSQLSGRNRNEKKRGLPPKKKKGPRVDGPEKTEVKLQEMLPVCLVVDGYNLLYEWEQTKKLVRQDLSSAREVLLRALANYQGYRNVRLIVVFDGYRIRDNAGSHERRGGLEIVYTRAGQPADAYIERLVHDNRGQFRLEVATSDGLIQNAVLASGAKRLSARELILSMEGMERRARESFGQYLK